MKLPIIIYEHGDILSFDSLAEACNYVEPIDVKNNEYIVYDSTGEILNFEVVVRRKKVFFVGLEKEEIILNGTSKKDKSGLSEKIRKFLALAGRDNLDENVSLPELVKMLPD